MKHIDISVLTREVKEVHEANPGWTLDNAFIHWFLQAQFFLYDSEAAARCVTGVTNDRGIDAIYVADTVSKVFILQGKFHRNSKPPRESRDQVLTFASLARSVLGDQVAFDSLVDNMAPSVKQKLTEARDRLHKRHYQLELYYITTGRCSAQVKTNAKREVAQAPGRVAINVLDRPDVLVLLTRWLQGEAPVRPLDLPIDARGIIGGDGSINRYDPATGIYSWIFALNGRDAADLYSQAGDPLFARDIRGFLGDTAINEGMKETLKHEPEKFWYFNNGITIVADSARKIVDQGRSVLHVENPQVINGLQTERTLHAIPSRLLINP